MKAHPTFTNILLTIITIGSMVTAVCLVTKYSRECRSLAANNRSLHEQLSQATHTIEAQQLSIGRLRMTIGELEELRTHHAKRIESLGVALRDVRSLTRLTSHTSLDTLVVRPSCTTDSDSVALVAERLADSCRHPMVWSDGWVRVALTNHPHGTHLHFTSRDTLTQVVYRVPYRWWIFRWGTKAIRQVIHSSNPHTQLVYAEYIQIDD